MTFRTILTTTTLMTATALFAAPVFADHHGSADHMKDKAKAAMSAPAAKAPLQQQKAEDLMQKAKQQMDSGLQDEAMDTAAKGVAMEMKAEANVDVAETMTGETLILETTGETADPMLGESSTALVNANPVVTKVIPPQGAMTKTSTASSAMSVSCPAGTTAQPDNTCMITGDYKQ